MADYLYSSARIRALENQLLGADRVNRLCDTGSVENAISLLKEWGVEIRRDTDGKFLREATILGRLRAAYTEIAGMADEPLFDLWRYPYDCNNLKAALKCFARGIEPDEMLFDFGTVDAETLKQAVRTRDFTAFPPFFATAADEAASAYAKTKNPQQIDLILDKACYAGMLAAAEKSGSDYTLGLVRAKIDLVNLVMCVRVLRMKSGEAGRLFLNESLISGGLLGTDFCAELYTRGEKGMWERLLYSEYAKFATAVQESDRSLTAIERFADDTWMELAKAAKFIPFGTEVLTGYLIAAEYEARNLRIALAGTEAGLAADTIRERIRDSYV